MFWEVAETRREIWRLLLAVVLIVVTWGGTMFVLAKAIQAIRMLFGATTLPKVLDFSSSPGPVVILLLTYAGLTLGIALAVWFLYRRRFRTLFGASERIRWDHFGLGVLAILAITLAMLLLTFLAPLFLPADILPEIRRNLDLSQWLTYLLPGLVAVAIQTSAEEFAFRGLLLQQLRARSANPLIWAVLPSCVFGLIHFDPSAFGETAAVLYVLYTTLAGIFLSIITLRTGNLGAALGLHFANNALFVLFVSLHTYLSGASLYVIAPNMVASYFNFSLFITYALIAYTLILCAAFFLWWRRA